MTVRLFFKLAICVLLLAGGSNMSIATSTRQTPPTLSAGRFYPEIRLRKLHLVRPDLIPYPISYKIYC